MAALDYVEERPDLRDADKLAFRDLLADVASSMMRTRSCARLASDLAVLSQIQARYDKELAKIFRGRLETRGLADRREPWESYLAFVRAARRTRRRCCSGAGRGASAFDDGMRGAWGRLAKARPRRFWPAVPPEKTVVLTFDDGPHARATDRPQIQRREILAAQNTT